MPALFIPGPNGPIVLGRSSGGGGGIPSSGLINQWIMDDAHVSGSTITDSIAGNNGTADTGVSSVAGPGSHTARGFDGSANAKITSSTNPYNWHLAFSVCGWVYLADNSVAGSGGTRQGYFCALQGVGDPGIRILNNTTVGAGCIGIGYDTGGTGLATSSSAVPNTTWTHFAITNDGTGGGGSGANTIIYINGSSVSTTSGNAPTSGSNLCFSGFSDGTGCINGRLYNFLIYNRAITAQEALDIYNAG